MIKIKDVNINIINDVKSISRISNTFIEACFKKYGAENLLAQIEQEYMLTPYEVGQHIRKDLEFQKHVCCICGKHITYSRHYKQWGSYCSANCVRRDPNSRVKAKRTMKEKYGEENALSISKFKNKAKKTNIERYGSDSYFKTEEFKKLRSKNINVKKYYQNRQNMSYDNISKYYPTDIPMFSKEDYEGVKKIYKWKCSKCGKEFEARYTPGAASQLCPFCRPKSAQESEIKQIIIELINSRGLNYNPIFNSRSIISPLELDIYIPELKLAIEYNGNYWHSTTHSESNKYYHLNKLQLCEEQGIKLISIFEYQWLNSKELIKQRLKNALGIYDNTIYARNCFVTRISAQEGADFINQNHLQLNCTAPGLIYYGLKTKADNELVAVMSFCSPRFNKNYEWELLRFCTKAHIPGAAGKLMKHFINEIRPTTIISYANRCWSNKAHNVYLSLGMTLIDESLPNYVWIPRGTRTTPNNIPDGLKYFIDNNIPLPRYKTQKHKLKLLLGEENFKEELTEVENMEMNGFVRLFDCGNLVFGWRKDK